MFIRFATEGDLNGILEIERLSFPIGKQWDRSDFQQALRDLFLVSGEKELSGFLIACCRENERKAVILRIAVHPEVSGPGHRYDFDRRGNRNNSGNGYSGS